MAAALGVPSSDAANMQHHRRDTAEIRRRRHRQPRMACMDGMARTQARAGVQCQSLEAHRWIERSQVGSISRPTPAAVLEKQTRAAAYRPSLIQPLQASETGSCALQTRPAA